MTTKMFDEACDNLMIQLDPTGHEERRWNNEEGATLALMKDHIEEIFASRDDLNAIFAETDDENQVVSAAIFTQDTYIALLSAKLVRNGFNIYVSEVSKKIGVLANSVPVQLPLTNLDEASVANAVGDAIRKITVTDSLSS